MISVLSLLRFSQHRIRSLLVCALCSCTCVFCACRAAGSRKANPVNGCSGPLCLGDCFVSLFCKLLKEECQNTQQQSFTSVISPFSLSAFASGILKLSCKYIQI